MDEKAQTSAEFILLFGGIFVVLLLVICMYRSYMDDLGSEIQSKEVNEFNNQLKNLEKYFI